jgi:signal peptidase II
MKARNLIILILLVLIIDQALKIYIKTTFPLNTARQVAGNWFQLYFVENPGMAYGWKFGGNWGKLALTIFRMVAVIFGTWYLGKLIREKHHRGFIICAGLIYAGALGNLIDSCFYGLIFDKGMIFDPQINEYVGYNGLAHFSGNGYASFLHGNVVDMLYFPIIHGHFPIADAAISTGVISILIFQKRFFRQHNKPETNHTVETGAIVDDASQVS